MRDGEAHGPKISPAVGCAGCLEACINGAALALSAEVSSDGRGETPLSKNSHCFVLTEKVSVGGFVGWSPRPGAHAATVPRVFARVTLPQEEERRVVHGVRVGR